jgi:hypothetical protein
MYERQQNMMPKKDYLPDCPTMSYFIALYFKARRIRLFGDVFVRTSSIIVPDEYHRHDIKIGENDKWGASLRQFGLLDKHVDIGLASARKPSR